MGLILSVVLERRVRFLTTDDVVLEECNNCLPNNKWLGFKYVSTVFGKTDVKAALLMICSTSNNTVCCSSKWLQKNWLLYSSKNELSPLVFPIQVLHENLKKYQIHYSPCIRGNSPHFGLAIWELSLINNIWIYHFNPKFRTLI